MDSELGAALKGKAKAIADQRGWYWAEPVEITSGVHKGDAVWMIRTNADMRGANILVIIRKSDQAVVHTGFLAR